MNVVFSEEVIAAFDAIFKKVVKEDFVSLRHIDKMKALPNSTEVFEYLCQLYYDLLVELRTREVTRKDQLLEWLYRARMGWDAGPHHYSYEMKLKQWNP